MALNIWTAVENTWTGDINGSLTLGNLIWCFRHPCQLTCDHNEHSHLGDSLPLIKQNDEDTET
jgi:hypothetical protein